METIISFVRIFEYIYVGTKVIENRLGEKHTFLRRYFYAMASATLSEERKQAHAFLASRGIEVDVGAFERDGCCVIRNFASVEECDGMRAAMEILISGWDPNEIHTFRTDEKQEACQGSSDYFLDSANQIGFFLEPAATDEESEKLKSGITKHEGLNKVGHGLHMRDPTFKQYSQSSKVAALVHALGWVDPVLPQSMYLFKQPRIGGEVTSHQDSTFLFTEPRQSCLGLWLALEKADTKNGCVWGRPGSHTEPVRRAFCRNPEWFTEGKRDVPQMIFRTLDSDSIEQSCPWEGKMPEGEDQEDAVKKAGFVPLTCEKGDLVLIHGQVDHLSLANTSGASRHTFQLHLVEGPRQGVQWCKRNWMQYPPGETFPELNMKYNH